MNWRFLYQPGKYTIWGLFGLGFPLLLLPFYALDRLLGVGIAGLVFVLVATSLSGQGLGGKVWRALGRLAARRRTSMAVVGMVAGCVAMSLSWLRPPVPQVHDEFSYLLAADTFASGRLTNPVHPLAEHFETFHVLSRPTRASKYPFAQGLVLAFGQVLTGQPIVGVWLSFSVACAALCWALQAWLPPRWALLGGLYVALHPFFQGGFWFIEADKLKLLSLQAPDTHQDISYSWSQSFWGGAVAMLGGALVYGGLPRIMSRPSAGRSALVGLGIVLLANSRPFEGAIVCLPAVVSLLIWLIRGITRTSVLARLGTVVVPCATILILGAAATAYYNQAVTGHALKLPYRLYGDQYDSTPMFLWEPRRADLEPPNEIYRRFYTEFVNPQYDEKQSLIGWLKSRPKMTLIPLAPYFWPITPALLWAPAAFRRRSVRYAVMVVLGLLVVQQALIGSLPHYLAPATCMILVIGLGCLRQLSVLRIGHRKVGRNWALALLALTPVLLAEVAIARMPPRGWAYDRAMIQARLEATGQRYLLLVRYGPGHCVHCEWVYNAADIDGAPVVWARELEPGQNDRLIAYFKNRQVLLVEADSSLDEITPYIPAHSHTEDHP